MWMGYGLHLLKLQRHCNYDIFLSSFACVPLSWKRLGVVPFQIVAYCGQQSSLTAVFPSYYSFLP